MLLTAAGLIASASAAVSQAPPPPMRGHPMEMRHGPRGHDGVALLLDHQLALQLTGAQVTQLITIHQQEVAQEKPLVARLMALMPRDRDRERGSIAPAQRDSLGAIRESMREIQWRQTSAAAAVLSDDQKRIAARLHEHREWGGRGREGEREHGPGGRPGMGRDSSAARAH
jgi:hypothetical protein